MCGIAGFRCFGKARPSLSQVEALFEDIVDRGKDASGIGSVGPDGKLNVFKRDVSATELVKDKKFKAYFKGGMPATLLLHTRATTRGSEKNNHNNHPVVNERGMALTHNGVILNYDEVVKSNGWKMSAQVDTEVILKCLEEKWFDGVEKVNELCGGFACAAIWAERPEELVLIRHSNPLIIAIDKEKDILWWASTKSAIEAATMEFHRGFLVRDGLPTFSITDDVALLVGEKGISKRVVISPKFRALPSGDGHWKGKGWGNDMQRTRFSGKEDLECEMCAVGGHMRVWNVGTYTYPIWACKDCKEQLSGGMKKRWCIDCGKYVFLAEDNGECPHCKRKMFY